MLNKTAKASFRLWDGFLRGSRNTHKLMYRDCVLQPTQAYIWRWVGMDLCYAVNVYAFISDSHKHTSLIQDRGIPSSSDEDENSSQDVKNKKKDSKSSGPLENEKYRQHKSLTVEKTSLLEENMFVTYMCTSQLYAYNSLSLSSQ